MSVAITIGAALAACCIAGWTITTIRRSSCPRCDGRGLIYDDKPIPDFCSCSEGQRGQAALDARRD